MDKLPPDAWEIIQNLAESTALQLDKYLVREPSNPKLEFLAKMRVLTLASALVTKETVKAHGVALVNVDGLVDEYRGFVEDGIKEGAD